MTYSETQAERVRGILGRRPGLTEKTMFGGISFLLEGNMAVGLLREYLIVHVDRRETDVLLREPGAKPFDLFGRGRAPEGWLLVEPSGYRTDADLRTWVDRGVAHASSQPPKKTKKPNTPKRGASR